MNLNKKDQTELIQVYETWLQSYLNGDVKTYDYYLDEQYRFVGSTGNEEFLNRKDTTKFFEKTADQLAGKTDLKNTVRTIELIDGIAFITDLFDAYFLMESDWKYYGRFRFTSALRKKKEGWRFIYQHFSMPDAKAQEGETLGAEQISKENQKLRDAIKRRTIELEQKNRELEIETALERVRSLAMSMQKQADLLKICKQVYAELLGLGFTNNELRNSQIVINNDDKKTYYGYQHSAQQGSEFAEVPYNIHPTVTYLRNQLKKADKAFVDITIKGKKLADWKDFVNSFPQKHDKKLNAATELHYYFHSVGIGALGISSYQKLAEEKVNLLHKFSTVFNLAYQRYQDITKAEAQALEAQIELGLERVRARAMAMQNSNELSELVDTVFQELTKLDFSLTACIINIIDGDDKSNTVWVTNPEPGKYPESYYLKFEDYAFHHGMWKAWKARKNKWVYTIEGAEKETYQTYLFNKTEFKRFSKNAQAGFLALEKWVASFTFSNFGGLQTVGDKPLSDASLDILARFGKVFDLTYTRFNDLKQAEAQAREAEIELALERVRARSLAMHKSEELNEVVSVVFENMKELQIPATAVGIGICIDGSKDLNSFVCGENEAGLVITNYRLPYFNNKISKDIINALAKQLDYFVGHYSKAEKNSFYKYVLEHTAEFKHLPDDIKHMIFESPTYTISMVAVKNAVFNINDFEGKILSENEIDIIKRFAKVFDQTYTRFLDLQKAEEQAREAEIELALERVRARTMAMQHSEELADVATVLFQQVKELGIPQWTCGFNIWETGDKEFTFYPGGPDGEILPSCKVPLMEHPIFRQFDESRKRGDELFIYEKEGEVQADHYRYMHALPGIGDMLQGMLDQGLEFPEFQIDHIANFLYGNIVFITYEPFPEMHQVFIRFAKVFEQTYTRFLDLQKAEAQAKEAQIEAALEKVRSRSLAMHKSDELSDVILEVKSKFQELDISMESRVAVVVVFDKNSRDFNQWVASPNFPNIYISTPYYKNPILEDFWTAKEGGVDFYSNSYSLKVKNSYFKYFYEHSTFKNIEGLEEQKKWLFEQEFYTYSPAIEKNSSIGIADFSGKVLTESEIEIIKRFAKVFEQAYIRFLDLQKAEAQAREAQIESALERVRSRSMAMHSSKELKEVIQLVYEQFIHLKIHIEHTGFIIDYKVNDDMHIWLADEHEVPSQVTIPYFNAAPWNSFIEAKKKNKNFYAVKLTFKEKNNFYKKLLKHIPDLPEEARQFYLTCPGLALSAVLLDNIGLYIENFDGIPFTEEENKILMRFGKVFQQTYTRFLDLQKAEAQAKEAQIEAALERVRSRAMALQKSEELMEVVQVIFEELKNLDSEMLECSIVTYDDTNPKDLIYWSAGTVTKLPTSTKLQYINHPMLIELFKDLKKGVQYRSGKISGKLLKTWWDRIFSETDFKFWPKDIITTWKKIKEVYYAQIIMNHGYLEFTGDSPMPEDKVSILKRFTNVIDLTYTRFDDLKQAEEQARESEIELALERVRARTMAMQHSDELPEAANNLFLQVQGLGIPAWSAGYCIWEEDKKSAWCNMSSEGEIQKGFSLPTIGAGYNFYKPLKNGETFYVAELGGKKLVKHYDFMKKLPIVGEILEEFDKKGIALPTFQIFHIVFFTHGYLMFITYESVPNAWDIFKRFGKVFDQTYTRFLDLQKAESQAKEAQIEATLQRIRAQVTAMKASAELLDIVVIMRQEFVKLGNEAHYFWHMRWLKNTYEKAMTSGDGTRIGSVMELPRGFHKNAAMTEWEQNKEPVAVFPFDADGAVDYVDKMISTGDFHLIDHNSPGPDDIRAIGGITFIMARTSHGEIGYSLPGFVANPPDEGLRTLVRFAKTFDLAYKRFEDLKNTELRTRETQIELALERVRSKSMAMHKSDELKQVINVISEQFDLLDIKQDACFINIFSDENSKDWNFWIATYPDQIQVPYTKEHKMLLQLAKARKNKKTFYTLNLKKKDKDNFFDYFYKNATGVKISKERRNFIAKASGWTSSVTVSKFTSIHLTNYSSEPYNEEENRILERIGNAFEQTYIRFLDLQKAEAQAKEAQIEAALERVRTKGMAMHYTSELQHVIDSVGEQFLALEIDISGGAFICINEKIDKELYVWGTGGTAIYDQSVNVPFFNRPIYTTIVKNIKQGPGFFTEEFSKKEKMEFFKHLFKNHPYNKTSIAHQKEVLSKQGGYVRSCIISKYTTIFIINHHGLKFSEAENNILIRFGKVFEQTYTRFLDLQKAEEQAKEAQIEMGLERVRAEMMAMHKSDELRQVVGSVFTQLQILGFEAPACSMIIYNEDLSAEHWFAGMGQDTYPKSYKIPFVDNLYFTDLVDAWKKGASFQEFSMEGKLKIAYAEWLLEHSEFKYLPKEFQKEMLKPDLMILSDAFNRYGMLEIIGPESLSESKVSILQRFSKVFEQTYTRFLDLKKAEEQAREAKIETSLERLRSSTMAMHKSKDLLATANLLYKEFRTLGITQYFTCGFVIVDEENSVQNVWVTDMDGEIFESFNLPLTGDPVFQLRYKKWQEKVPVFYQKVGGVKLKKHLAYAIPHFGSEEAEDMVANQFPDPTYFYMANFSHGYLHIVGDSKLTENEEELLARFMRVFEQTYTRFLDLKKAEEQARESQIEAALERVRSKTMAMHNSKDVEATVVTLFEEILKLDVDKSMRCGIGILSKSEDMELWTASFDAKNKVSLDFGKLNMKLHPLLTNVKKAWKDKKQKVSFRLIGEEVINYFKILNSTKDYSFHTDLKSLPNEIFQNSFIFSEGILYIFTTNPVPVKTQQVLSRFTGVFEQTYTRFLDLQKAEEQAREAQIEAALERVRAKAMAMHSTEDLTDTVGQLFQELDSLDISLLRCGVGRIHKDTKIVNLYTYSGEVEGAPVPILGNAELAGHPVLDGSYQGWIKQEEYHATLKGASLKKYYEAIKADFKLPRKQKSKIQYAYFFYFSAGCLYTFTETPFTDEELSIFRKFNSVVGLTYRRYLDLEEAEEQAREAQIEASLERVRSKAMAMHNSKDLVTTASQLFKEFQYLDISFIRCGVLKIEESRKAEVFAYSLTKDKKAVAVYGEFNLSGHELMDGVFAHWQLQKEYFHEMNVEAVKRYYQLLNKQIDIPKIQQEKSHFGYAFYFPEGCLYCFTNKKFSEDTLRILRKFNSVMGLTYRRYFELQEAEARELVAIKESSLDRVRAEITSMRTADDLNRITPIVWKELTTLGVPFFRCGVFIVDKQSEKVQAYLSSPSGESLAALELDFDSVPLVQGVVSNWKKQKVYIEKWNKEQFIEFTQPLIDQGQINSSKKYQGGLEPPEKLVLQMVPFKQGMLYVGSENALSEDHISMVESLARAFSIAYTRYEDFKELEAAKGRAEDTLSELKSTQTQLIQSEKMASLGELTAGIAHEIQNPLNFVNNFSELSEEMVEELAEEIKDNSDEIVTEIMTDLKQNLNKITNHGKRASSIVKGMLEHSRTTSGNKELTDINALADEFLRLSYHGLRAKDKTFNAAFKTDLDTSLPKIKVVAQDLGRVILNLINNAFYACAERSRSTSDKDYKPLVTVSTTFYKSPLGDLGAGTGSGVKITVKDNGSGIPDKIKDKIFQPFFTTKPTGSGTGLGLSMSYDIIAKGHGGELTVKSKKGEFTEFTIVLPVKN
jgi:signal transduction histidine kinase